MNSCYCMTLHSNKWFEHSFVCSKRTFDIPFFPSHPYCIGQILYKSCTNLYKPHGANLVLNTWYYKSIILYYIVSHLYILGRPSSSSEENELYITCFSTSSESLTPPGAATTIYQESKLQLGLHNGVCVCVCVCLLCLPRTISCQDQSLRMSGRSW